MAILQNGFRDFSSGVRMFGATVSNSAYPYALIGNTDKASLKRNLTAGEGFSNRLVSVPSGYRMQYAYVQPQKAGGLKSFRESEGVATATAQIAGGKNAVGSSAGSSTVTGTAQLVVSGSGTATGSATVTGNLKAALAGAGSSAGSSTVSGSIGALAWCQGAASGVATATLTRYATGRLAGSIAPAVTLEASSFSSHLLDAEDIETGMTLRQAMRLVAAATAGKVSGAAGSTVTIRGAVADSKSRIVATVDASGNRSAIAYDLSD